MLAFGIDEFGGSIKNDERYIKWVARLWTVKEGEIIYDYLPVRNCSS